MVLQVSGLKWTCTFICLLYFVIHSTTLAVPIGNASFISKRNVSFIYHGYLFQMLLRQPAFLSGSDITVHQLEECYTNLDRKCLNHQFDSAVRIRSNTRQLDKWELEPQLFDKLRVALFDAHSVEYRQEKLALCFLIEKPSIFDLKTLRSDPACLIFSKSRFHLISDILTSQRILCAMSEFTKVFFMCSRIAPSPLYSTVEIQQAVTYASKELDLFPPPVIQQDRRHKSILEDEKLKCALVWIVGVLLALITVLIIGILVHTLTHRQDYYTAPPSHYINDKTSLVEENGNCASDNAESEV